jgi:hypothetical protein
MTRPPTARPAPSAPPQDPPRAPVREAISLFSLKAIVTSLGGALLTLFIWFLQTSYSNHVESLRRQSDHGAEYQTRLLSMTGRVADELGAVLDRARRAAAPGAGPDALAALNARAGHELAEAMGEWESAKLLLRNQGAQLYGAPIARLIHDSADEDWNIDHCSILDPPGAPEASHDCGPRRATEAAALYRLIAAPAGAPQGGPSPSPRPLAFAFNLDATNAVLDRVVQCLNVAPDKREAEDGCQNFGALLRIAIFRHSLLLNARMDLADALMAQTEATRGFHLW